MLVMGRKGDSLWYYSQLFDIPLQLLIDANQNLQPQQSMEGRELTIPGYIRKNKILEENESIWSHVTERQLSIDAISLLNPDLPAEDYSQTDAFDLPIRVDRRFVHHHEPYDSERLQADAKKIERLYPFVKQEVIGKSHLGQPIIEFRIGRGNKRVHYNGAFHANEWITTNVLMTFINDYLLALTNRRHMRGLHPVTFYDQVTLSIVPMVNPDGVDLVVQGLPDEIEIRQKILEMNGKKRDFSDWKANIQGIDLNDQFPASWELEKAQREAVPGPRDYPGERPLSEPEAVAMHQLVQKRDFDRVFAFHTQGKEIYWGYEAHEPEVSLTMANEMSRVSGYKNVRYVRSYAGFKDWFIQYYRRPGFTVELGEGRNPLPIEDFDRVYQEGLGILLAGLYV